MIPTDKRGVARLRRLLSKSDIPYRERVLIEAVLVRYFELVPVLDKLLPAVIEARGAVDELLPLPDDDA